MMKKLAFLFLILVSCSNTMPEFETFSTFYSTLLTVTGTDRHCHAKKSGTSWNNTRGAFVAGTYNLNPLDEFAGSKNIATVYTVNRLGLVFDISALPESVVIDSVFLQVYNKGGVESFGLAIYRAPYLKVLVNSTADYRFIHGAGTYPDGIPFDILTNSQSLLAGYNTFKVNDLPGSDWYGAGFVSYGIGGWDHDYLNAAPSLFQNSTVEIDFDTFKPKLLIYYSTSIPTPSSTVKIYTIF